MLFNILSFVCDAWRGDNGISQNFKTYFAAQIVRYFTLLQNENKTGTLVRYLNFDRKEIKRKFELNELKMWRKVDCTIFVDVYNKAPTSREK